MTAKDFIVAIELGSSKITGIAGKRNSDGSIQILAYAREEASSFIRKGIVYNIDKMGLSLTSIINKLEPELDATIAKVYVGLGGQSLRSKKNFIVRQMEDETKIQKEFVDAILESDRQTSYPDLDILDVVPQEYKVKSTSVIDPVGMMSNQIEGRFLNIVARSSVKQNLLAAFQQANLEIAGLLIAPICTADILLKDNEKRSGCALVDFGADTTTVAIYKNDLLRHLVVLPIGSNNITKDISNSLQVDENDAELLKIKYGYAYIAPEEKETGDKSYPLDEERSITVDAEKLNGLVEARTEEIIANILNQIEIAEYTNKLKEGLVLTGGGANLKRLAEAFQRKDYKVRIANFVPLEIKTTKPELLSKNGRLNTLFGLLAAGKENCCEVTPQRIPETLFTDETMTDNSDELRKQQDEERARQEEEAKKIAEDDEYWEECRNTEKWDAYMERYPEGRHIQEAQQAMFVAAQKQKEKEDDDYWEICLQNEKKPWSRYLKRYPNGRHAEEARKEQNKSNGKSIFTRISDFGKKILDEDE